ncbi:hypothetical protein KDI_53880 [Dictyobacter arantiisoli]|uniref:Uncharacterized protein n=1 Tax=Dictyobacter arantiisoli TaxID=2014874 RepID=A0A5A5TLG5_9CHLR|nr:hypothetical protein KDI_53880 [Dictyobacter arantiisoli]
MFAAYIQDPTLNSEDVHRPHRQRSCEVRAYKVPLSQYIFLGLFRNQIDADDNKQTSNNGIGAERLVEQQDTQ